jgi:hypothetical protein
MMARRLLSADFSKIALLRSLWQGGRVRIAAASHGQSDQVPDERRLEAREDDRREHEDGDEDPAVGHTQVLHRLDVTGVDFVGRIGVAEEELPALVDIPVDDGRDGDGDRVHR